MHLLNILYTEQYSILQKPAQAALPHLPGIKAIGQ